MMHAAPFTLIITIAAVGTVGNLFIIGAVCLYRRLRTLGHAFVVNLAVADLMITGYIMPIGLASSQFHENPFPQEWCDVNAFLIMCVLCVSTQTLAAIGLERYFHICQTKFYRRIFTRGKMVIYISMIWIFSALISIQGYTGWTQYIYLDALYLCILDAQDSLSYNICLVLVAMVIPMIVVAFSYVNIFIKVRKSNTAVMKNTSKLMTKMQRHMRGEYRFTLTLFAIVIVFIICWAPSAFTVVLARVTLNVPRIAYQITTWLSLCNSSMNGIIYGVMNKNFRTGYKQLLSHLCLCRGPLRKQCMCLCPGLFRDDSSLGKTPSRTRFAMSDSEYSNDQDDRKGRVMTSAKHSHADIELDRTRFIRSGKGYAPSSHATSAGTDSTYVLSSDYSVIRSNGVQGAKHDLNAILEGPGSSVDEPKSHQRGLNGNVLTSVGMVTPINGPFYDSRYTSKSQPINSYPMPNSSQVSRASKTSINENTNRSDVSKAVYDTKQGEYRRDASPSFSPSKEHDRKHHVSKTVERESHRTEDYRRSRSLEKTSISEREQLYRPLSEGRKKTYRSAESRSPLSRRSRILERKKKQMADKEKNKQDKLSKYYRHRPPKRQNSYSTSEHSASTSYSKPSLENTNFRMTQFRGSTPVYMQYKVHRGVTVPIYQEKMDYQTTVNNNSPDTPL